MSLARSINPCPTLKCAFQKGLSSGKLFPDPDSSLEFSRLLPYTKSWTFLLPKQIQNDSWVRRRLCIFTQIFPHRKAPRWKGSIFWSLEVRESTHEIPGFFPFIIFPHLAVHEGPLSHIICPIIGNMNSLSDLQVIFQMLNSPYIV